MNVPDEVWAETDTGWAQLKKSANSVYASNGIEVTLKQARDAARVGIRSPQTALKGVRLKWKYQLQAIAKSLGDSWERIYGNVAWVSPSANVQNPWYLLLHDSEHTSCYGV